MVTATRPLNSFQPITAVENSLIDDRYRLQKCIGSGGMGEVFLAIDLRLGKPVALKRLKESVIAKDFDLKKRFERECGICAALKSQHIVQVSDYGVTPEKYPFYVMEYLQGQTLGELLSTQIRLPVSQACQIIGQVCAGLELAHAGVTLWDTDTKVGERIKVIHRDLKPANIFLVSTALGELVKIIDFGIAKIHFLSTEATNATSVFLGTSHYAAPEQFEMSSAIDERTDIYSLGMILYEMLVGVDPFGFDFHNHKISGIAWGSAHISQLPQPLRSQPNGMHLSADLEAVVMKCLEKAPDNRFPSVAAFNQALQAANSKSSTFSYQPSTSNSAPVVEITKTLITETNVDSPASHTAIDSSLTQSSSSVLWTRLLVGLGIATAISIGVYSLSQDINIPFISASKQATSSSISLTDTLLDHTDTVWSVALSADGQTLASGSEDQTIKLWNLKTGQINRTLSGHTASVRSIGLSPDGQTLASGSSDRTIKLWNVQTGQLRQTLEGHSDTVWSVAFDRTGQLLISGSGDNTIKLWNVQTGQLRQTLEGHSGPVYSVALSPDGQTLASGSGDRTMKLWNAQTGALLYTLEEHGDAVRAVAFSPDGQQIASASWDNTVRIWNVQTGELVHTLQGHRDRVVAVTFLADGQIASASLDRTLKIWDAQTGQLRQTLEGHSDWVVAVAASASDSLLVSGSKDKTIRLWQ
jgi:WD40 repeat protein